jgi:hypothetical protein
MIKKIFPVALALCVALVYRVLAQEPEAKTEKEVKFPSPDGKFAFLQTIGPEIRTVDLIEKKSEKVLLRIAESDEDHPDRLRWSVLWAPDSKRFALSYSTMQKRTSEVCVYFRDGESFRKIELPKMPDSEIPDRLTRGKHLDHIVSMDYEDAIAWKKDGSLVVDIESLVDGNGISVSATRRVVLGFDRSGKARILKSTLRFKEAKNE